MGLCTDRPHHIWPRLKDLVRFPNATFLQHTLGEDAFLSLRLPSRSTSSSALGEEPYR